MTRREEEIMVLTTVMLGWHLWGYATAPRIAWALGLEVGRVRQLLRRLEDDGEVERGGIGAYGAVVWVRTRQY